MQRYGQLAPLLLTVYDLKRLEVCVEHRLCFLLGVDIRTLMQKGFEEIDGCKVTKDLYHTKSKF